MASSVFDDKSRYRDTDLYTVTDRNGKDVTVVAVPDAPSQTELGIHRRSEGQRLDLLAQKYLANAAGFWRLCELNDAMWPDAIAETSDVHIPRKA
jgi:hypothetical protein